MTQAPATDPTAPGAAAAHRHAPPQDESLHSAVPRVQTPLLTLRATSGWAALNLHELWHFRDLMMTLAGRDIKVRYKQTLLGVAWVVLQPLLGAGVLSFVFGKVAKLSSGHLPYFLFTYTGMLGWNVFNSTLNKTSNSLVGNAHLISKVYFPRLVLPFSSTISTLVDFSVTLAMMGLLLVFYHIVPTWRLAFLPLFWLLTVLLAMGLGLIAAALMVVYRDVGYMLPVFTQLLFYISPIAYDVSHIDYRLHRLYFFNPVAGLMEAYRWTLLNDGIVTWWQIGYIFFTSIGSFLLGAVMFKRMERMFADII